MKNRAQLKIGEVHLAVADMERSLAFYCNLLGLQVARQFDDVILLSPGAHHRIMLDPPHRAAIRSPPHGYTGFYRFSFLYPERRELARIVRRLMIIDYRIDTVLDYGMTVAVYLRDPDGIPVELYVERPKEQWPRNEWYIVSRPLDLASLLKELL